MKLDLPKEWFERAAKREADSEKPEPDSFNQDWTAVEMLAHGYTRAAFRKACPFCAVNDKLPPPGYLKFLRLQ